MAILELVVGQGSPETSMIFHTQIKRNNVLAKQITYVKALQWDQHSLLEERRARCGQSGGQGERQGDEDTTAGRARHEGLISVMEDTAGF